MSLIKAELNIFREELRAVLPVMVAEAVRKELDARGLTTGTLVTQEFELTGDGISVDGAPLPPAKPHRRKIEPSVAPSAEER